VGSEKKDPNNEYPVLKYVKARSHSLRIEK
jgi:hypothetical protein